MCGVRAKCLQRLPCAAPLATHAQSEDIMTEQGRLKDFVGQ